MSYLLTLSCFLLCCSITLSFVWISPLVDRDMRETVGCYVYSTFEAGTFLLFICFLLKLAGFELGW